MAAAAKQMMWDDLSRGEFHGCYRWLMQNIWRVGGYGPSFSH